MLGRVAGLVAEEPASCFTHAIFTAQFVELQNYIHVMVIRFIHKQQCNRKMAQFQLRSGKTTWGALGAGSFQGWRRNIFNLISLNCHPRHVLTCPRCGSLISHLSRRRFWERPFRLVFVRAFWCKSCEGRSLLYYRPDFGCEFVRVFRRVSTPFRGYLEDLAKVGPESPNDSSPVVCSRDPMLEKRQANSSEICEQIAVSG